MQYKIEAAQQGPRSPGDMVRSAAQFLTLGRKNIVYFTHSKCTGWQPGSPSSADIYLNLGESGGMVTAQTIEDDAFKSKIQKTLAGRGIPTCNFY